MYYLVDNMLIDKANREKVEQILAQITTDIHIFGDKSQVDIAIVQLKEIGETKLVEMIENNEFTFNIA